MDVIMTSVDDPHPGFANSSIAGRLVNLRPCHLHDQTDKKPSQRRSVCKFWVKGNCKSLGNCKFLHSWFRFGNGFSMLARLQGHTKAIVGIANPLSSDKLYTASRDGSVRVWDCYSGNCDKIINLGAEIGCFICQDSWVFIGLPNSVRVWKFTNSSNYKEFSLDGPTGQVYALAVFKDMLFAGSTNGDIIIWRGSFEANPFSLMATLKGHRKAVVSLAVGSVTNTLYSGSIDGSVKVWNMETLQCKQTMNVHRDAVLSLLSWDRSLLTSSLDHRIKFWNVKEGGTLELVNTREEKAGIVKIYGMPDAQGKPVVLCSCNDNGVRLYDLESFGERDRIFAQEEVRDIQRGPYGLFFTGDATGVVTVWQWL